MQTLRRLSVAMLVALLMISATSASSAAAEEPQVIITGGSDQTHHVYSWDVVNRSKAHIVRIEFPHYAADLFYTPDTWKQGTLKEMNLVTPGWDDKSTGVCWSEPVPPDPGLAPGATATFGMRITAMGAFKGTGTVLVRFDDGTSAAIPGVELPEMPARPSPYLGVIAMGLILFIFILVRELRRRRRPVPVGEVREEEVEDQR